jgi:hypothetical protein
MTSSERGQTLIGFVIGLAVSVLLLGTAAGALSPAVRRRDVESATRLIEARFRAASWRAMRSGRDEAFLLDEGASRLVHLRDGDGDGVNLPDYESGEDSVVGILSLSAEHPGARLGPVPWPGVPSPPTGPSLLSPDNPGVRFGRDALARFTAAGHAQPGSLLVVGRREHLCAVVVSGAGARVRSYCFDRNEGTSRRR